MGETANQSLEINEEALAIKRQKINILKDNLVRNGRAKSGDLVVYDADGNFLKVVEHSGLDALMKEELPVGAGWENVE